MVTLLALVVLGAIAVGVVFVLPGMVEPGPAPPPPDRSAAVATPSGTPSRNEPAVERSGATDDLSQARREAEQLLGQVLRQQAALESLQVAAWAGEDYQRVLAELERGDGLFGQGEYPDAARTYGQVLADLRALESSMQQRHDTAMEAGAAALAQFDGAQAKALFSIALAIAPDDAAARRGLERAAKIEEVAGLLASGRAHEEARELAAASRDYARALELDPEVGEARTALARVQARVAEREYRQAMSDALAAMERGELEAAKKSLDLAAKLRPGSKAVGDARTQLRARRQAHLIASHRRRAEAMAAREQWAEAAVQYRAVLEIDPHVAFALGGLTRAETLARIHRRLDLYVDDPSRLASQAPFEDAKALARGVDELDPKGPELERKLRRLNELIALAETPVSVTLHSDGQTEVTVYKVGRLGRFDTQRIMLRPGRYTVVGSRPGYRDVRHEFEVKAGNSPRPIDVRCKEPI